MLLTLLAAGNIKKQNKTEKNVAGCEWEKNPYFGILHSPIKVISCPL